MEEERLRRTWKLGGAMVAVLLASITGWLIYTLVVISHDKSANSELQTLWLHSEGVPVGIVQPGDNRWIKQAFVADRSREEGKKIAVLILDDHYRSNDALYRSKSGVIGDQVGREVLCSIPSQASTKKVRLDTAVQRLIASECR